MKILRGLFLVAAIMLITGYAAAAPAAFDLLAPANAATSQFVTPTFSWEATNPGTTFVLEYYINTGTFPGNRISPTPNTLTSLASLTFNEGDSITWRVIAYDGLGDSTYSTSTQWFLIQLFNPLFLTITPDNGAYGGGRFTADLTPLFDWSDVPFADQYYVELSAGGFVEPGYPVLISGDSQFQIPIDLTAGVTYEYRVRARNSGNLNMSFYSDPFIFTPIVLPTAPAIVSPANLDVNVALTGPFTWGSSSGGGSITYNLEIADDALFTSIIRDIDPATSPHTLAVALNYNTHYWWRVKVTNEAGTTTSAVNSFWTRLPAPANLTIAPSGSPTPDLTPSFNWDDVPGADEYVVDITIGGVSIAGYPFTISGGVNSNYTVPTNLVSGTNYVFHVYARNSVTTNYSTEITLSFQPMELPSAPGLLSPGDLAVGIDLTGPFSWSSSTGGGTITYNIEIATDAGFVSIVRDIDPVTSPHTLALALEYNTRYWWRVIATNEGGSTSSTIRSFYTSLPPIGSITITPGGTPVPDLTPSFNWGDVPGSDQYIIDIRISGITIGGIYPFTISGGGNSNYTVLTDLAPGTTYEVCVYARNSITGNISPTECQSFTTLGLPAAFTLTGPSNGAPNVIETGPFSWNPSSGGTITYNLEIATDAGFVSIVRDITPVTSPYTLTIPLNPGTTYWWRVIANNQVGSTTSPVWSFTTRGFEAPVLLFPQNNSTGHPVHVRFEWTEVFEALTYEIQIDDEPGFSLPMYFTSVPHPRLYYDLPSTLTNGTRYYWRVRTHRINHSESAWSPTWTFTITTDGISGLAYPIPNNPVNGTVVYVDNPYLSWYMSTSWVGIDRFDIEYKAGDDDFSSGVIQYASTTNIGGHTVQISGLSADMDYYWRVRAYDEGDLQDYYSAWSQIAHFKTDESISGAPSKPTPLYPVNNVIVYHDDTPLLHWYVTAFNQDLRFDIQLARVEAGPVFVPIFNYTTLTPQLWMEANARLEAGKQYRWRVRTTKAGFPASDWSDYVFFTMDQYSLGVPGEIPTPLYPVNNATEYTGNPTLHWYITSYIPGVEWDVQVQGVSVVYDQTYSSTSYQYYYEWPDQLSATEEYRWRVRAKKTGYSSSNWSGWATFNIYEYANGVPVKPTPVWPVENATIYVNPPLLSWYVTPYVPDIQYEVEVKPFGISFNGTGTIPTGSYQQFHQLTNVLTPGARYHWRVRSFVPGPVYSTWSEGADFTIDAHNALGSLPQPVLVYPSGGLSVYVTKPILSWYTNTLVNVTGFRIRIATDPLFVSELPGSPYSSTAMHFAPDFNLVNGTTYYWRVESTDGLIYSTPSMTGEFTVEPGSSAPVVPKIGGPDGIDLQTTSANLSWFLPVAAQAELSYEVEYSTQKDFSQSIKIDNITASNYRVTNLKAGTEYYWRVRSVTKENQASGYSFRGTFVPAGVTGVEESGVIPEKFEVGQNYPNPFNPVTNIRVNMPESGILSIKIFNILGQEVMTLINQEMNAGVHTLQWSGENNFGQKVPSGTYIYRVIAGDNSCSMKMVLMK